MKYFLKSIIAIILLSTFFVGCEDMLEVDSEAIVNVEDHQINSANDSLYSVIGIMSQMNDIADRYFILGELRADLVTLTEYANSNLKEIEDNNISKENPYADASDFYEIINNCNYVINNIDTSVFVNGEYALLKEYSIVKAIRAWTYMQLALNYNEVKYYEKPILTTSDTLQDVKTLNLQQLTPILIEDLVKIKDNNEPYNARNMNYKYYFIPVNLILGDLYLWDKQYINAALAYHDLIDSKELIISSNYGTDRMVENGIYTGSWSSGWSNRYSGFTESVSLFYTSFINKNGSTLTSLTWPSTYTNAVVQASNVAINKWRETTCYIDSSLSIKGDIREDMSILSMSNEGRVSYSDLDYEEYMTPGIKYIMKYSRKADNSGEYGIIATASHVYLRFAEALNNAGYPYTALAVLKEGLNTSTLTDTLVVPTSERIVPTPEYLNFAGLVNSGIHARSCGYYNNSAGRYSMRTISQYGIPEGTDSISAMSLINSLILEEYALETAFEGNRFHDLMRFALRDENPGEFMSEQVGKHNEVAGERLREEKNWYLPIKE